MAEPAVEQQQPWELMHELAAGNHPEQLRNFVKSIGTSETFRAMLRLDASEREKVLTTLSAEDAADFIEDIPEQHAAEMMRQIPVEQAASILGKMGSDDQADVLGEMKTEHADALLGAMHPDDAANIQRLISHDPDTAGGLMMSEFIAYHEDAQIGDVIAGLGKRSRPTAAFGFYIYVVNARGKLTGVVDLHSLIFSERNAPIAFIRKSCLSVFADTSLSELDDFFDNHAFLSVPVVDRRHRLVGVVQRQSVAESQEKRAVSDYSKSQGIIGDEIRTQPLLLRSRRRVSWLSLNIVLNIISASVIALYQDTLAAVIALAVFLPIVSDMSGCSGNQAVAVSMRELSLGLIKPYEIMRVWLKEVSVGMINGVILGCLLAMVAWAWQGNPYLGLVVGAALFINTVIAVSIGGTVPLLLKRMGKDPAAASGPILTTVTDMCGFFLVLSLASALLPQLNGG